VVGWQREYQRAEDELDDPHSLALPNWDALSQLAAALVARSAGHFAGWGEVVIFAACTAARIGEVSGVRRADIDRDAWTWTVRRQTTPGPGGLIDKGTLKCPLTLAFAVVSGPVRLVGTAGFEPATP
jgi:integrase